MPYDVSKLWSQRDIEQSIEGWGATDYYSVTGTPTELADERNLLLAPGLPRIGSSHPTNRTLTLYALQAGPGLSERVISARYQWLPNGLPQGNSTDPLTQPIRIRWSRVTRQETLPTDIYGNQITNSAGDASDPGPQFERMSRILEIVRYEREYKPEIADKYENTVNSMDMFAGKRKFTAGTVLCMAIYPSQEYTPDAKAIEITYQFEIRSRFGSTTPTIFEQHPFRWWVADRGVRGYAAANAERVDLYTKEPGTTAGTYEIGNQLTDAVNFYRGAPIQKDKFYAGSNKRTPVENSKLPTSKTGPLYVKNNDVWFIGWEVYKYANLLELGL